MPKRSSSKRLATEDVNEAAFRVVREATAKHDPEAAHSEKNPAAVALGRLGGKKGGPARAARLTAKRRSDIAKRAARARWSRRPEA